MKIFDLLPLKSCLQLDFCKKGYVQILTSDDFALPLHK